MIMMMKKKKFLFIFLSFLLSLILIISILEIAVRIITSNGLNLDIEMLKYAKSFKVISENKDVGLEHRTNIKKKLMNVDIVLNSQGFRNSIDIDHSKKKILMLGDSITLGWGAQNTFSYNLEKLLNNNIQVLNAGIGNTNTYMQINNFFQNYSKYDFEMIVLNFFVNDFEKIIIKKSNFFIENFYSISYFNRKVLKILIKNSLADNYENFYLKTSQDENFVQESLSLIKKINEYCKKEKIIFIINYMPELRDMKNYKFNKQIEIMENFSKQNGIKFINSLDILQNYEDNTLWVTIEDSHYNDKAHLLISKFLKRKLAFELNSFM